jgi:hypothetical protein
MRRDIEVGRPSGATLYEARLACRVVEPLAWVLQSPWFSGAVFPLAADMSGTIIGGVMLAVVVTAQAQTQGSFPMKPQTSLAADGAPKTSSNGDPARLFYSAAAALLLVLAFIGFHRFYIHGRAYPDRELTPPIRTLVILHGVVMSGWMLLFVTQPLLILKRGHRIHMKLGWLGAALATGVVVLGVRLAIESARVTPPEARIWGLPPRQFMAVPLIVSVAFALYVAVAVWKRRRPEIHRAMMLLGTLAAMSAAISRIDTLNNLYVGTTWETIFGPFFTTLVIGALLLLSNGLLTRRFDKWLAGGLAVLTVIFLLIVQIAPTPAWSHFAGFLLD